jgi:hypothetical protein
MLKVPRRRSLDVCTHRQASLVLIFGAPLLPSAAPPCKMLPLPFLHSLTLEQPFTYALILRLTGPLTNRSVTHLLIHSFIRSSARSRTRSLTHSLSRSVTHSVTQAVTESLSHSFTHSLILTCVQHVIRSPFFCCLSEQVREKVVLLLSEEKRRGWRIVCTGHSMGTISAITAFPTGYPVLLPACWRTSCAVLTDWILTHCPTYSRVPSVHLVSASTSRTLLSCDATYRLVRASSHISALHA